jgi:hypothetical protein
MPLHPLFRAALCAALACACSEQGEGERCDTNNGDLDCQSGLVCRSGESLNLVEGEGRGAALCCPPSGVLPSVDACRVTSGVPEERDASVPPEENITPPATGDAGDGGP